MKLEPIHIQWTTDDVVARNDDDDDGGGDNDVVSVAGQPATFAGVFE